MATVITCIGGGGLLITKRRNLELVGAAMTASHGILERPCANILWQVKLSPIPPWAKENTYPSASYLKMDVSKSTN